MTTTAGAIAAFLNGQLFGADASMPITRPATLQKLEPNTVAFAKALTPERLKEITRVGSALVLVPHAELNERSFPYIECTKPRLAFARVIDHFFAPRPSGKIQPSSTIDPTAKIAGTVTIGEHCTIGENVTIGEGTELRQNVVVGRNVKIGRNCLIKSCSVIGEEGFGIEKDEQGNNLRLPHIGSVVIGHNVEVGALNTIASGTIDPTVIEDFVKMDDHIHVAHNCRIGRNCIITACAEISGSVTIGANVWIGPNAALMNGISIGCGVTIGLGAVVTKSFPENVTIAGCPARIVPDK